MCATSVIRRGILELIVGLTKRNNKKLIPLNWMKGIKINVIKISVTFYLLQTVRSVTKINGLLILDIHIKSVPIERCSLQGRVVFMGNSATNKVIGEITI